SASSATSVRRPRIANRNCVAAWMSTSTMTLAAASAPGTAYNVSKPAPMRSPPTCASGNRTLVASRTNRSTTHVRSCGRIFEGNSSHHPAPATHDKGDGARQHDEQNAPAYAGNRLANGTEAGPDDKTDERGDSTQPRDHAGLLDHWRPDSHDVLDATCGRPRTKSRGTPTV